MFIFIPPENEFFACIVRSGDPWKQVIHLRGLWMHFFQEPVCFAGTLNRFFYLKLKKNSLGEKIQPFSYSLHKNTRETPKGLAPHHPSSLLMDPKWKDLFFWMVGCWSYLSSKGIFRVACFIGNKILPRSNLRLTLPKFNIAPEKLPSQ